MAALDERKRLLQTRSLESLQRHLSTRDMVTVYLDLSNSTFSHCILCALVPSSEVEQVLSEPFWNFHYEDGAPSAIRYHDGRNTRVEYCRFGRDDGIEPLVVCREFSGIRKGYVEICEEFRLFHSLHCEPKRERYTKVDESGNEDLVAVVKPNEVKIRLNEIRRFLSIKEMHLMIQFNCQEYSTHTLEQLGLAEGDTEHHDELSHWKLRYASTVGILDDARALSALIGKRLIEPVPKSKSGFWGFSEERKKYEEFIIGTDENGDDVTYTSNPDLLANYFGANPEAPHYLTIVSFRKTVLDKYYQHPEKYSVSEGIVRCGSLWGVQIDNHHQDKVCVWLGDLGRDLPHIEQLHWKAHNIPAADGVSQTYFRRQILNQPAESLRAEHVFQKRYRELQKACDSHLGWPLLRKLGVADQYHLQNIRIPAVEAQPSFDALVLSLTKVLVDSINEKKLTTLVSRAKKADAKGGILLLEAALSSVGASSFKDHVEFLRQLQALRSSGSAHRKGKNYKRALNRIGQGQDNLEMVATALLEKSISLIEYFIALVEESRLRVRS